MNIREQIQTVNTILSKTLDLYRLWAKKNKINYNTLLVLYTLDEKTICTQKQICECWALPKQTVHGILAEFDKKGYICDQVNPTNKKERLISFTDVGKQYADQILQPLYKMEEKAMLEMDEASRQHLIDCDEQYYELLRKEINHG